MDPSLPIPRRVFLRYLMLCSVSGISLSRFSREVETILSGLRISCLSIRGIRSRYFVYLDSRVSIDEMLRDRSPSSSIESFSVWMDSVTIRPLSSIEFAVSVLSLCSRRVSLVAIVIRIREANRMTRRVEPITFSRVTLSSERMRRLLCSATTTPSSPSSPCIG